VALDPLGVRVERGDADLVAVRVDVEIDSRAREAVDVGHPVEAEVAERVIEGAVLHHQHDDVADLLK